MIFTVSLHRLILELEQHHFIVTHCLEKLAKKITM